MRTAAQTYSNAYVVGIFACCREIFLVTQHSEGISLAQKNEIDQKRKVEDQRRHELLMKIITSYFARIIDMKKEQLQSQ